MHHKTHRKASVPEVILSEGLQPRNSRGPGACASALGNAFAGGWHSEAKVLWLRLFNTS